MPLDVGINLKKMSKLTEKEYEIAQWCFELVGVFNHYRFFTDKLWRKVSGFKNKDEAEVKCAFMHYWFHNTFHYNTLPVNSSWFAELDEKDHNEYIKEYEPVIKAFTKWANEQR
jgi:hypothetical protein